jgi:polyphosphate kinase 2 (PPK2 family)
MEDTKSELHVAAALSETVLETPDNEAVEAKPPRLTTADIRKDEAAIAQLFEQGVYPYRTRMRRVAYEKEKAKLQVELLKVQRWARRPGRNS